MNKPRPIHILKTAALTVTIAAAAALGLQLGNGHTNPITLTFTVLAVLLTGIALADDTARTFRRIRHLLTHIRLMTGRRFRKTHGDPAGWDDDEYEAYFAWTAPAQAPDANTHTPAA